MTKIKLTTPAIAVAALLLALSGCAADSGPANSDPADSPRPSETSGGAAGETTAPGELTQVMSQYDLDKMGAVDLIDHLDRLGGADRPTELMASVRPGELVLSAGEEEQTLDVPGDRFYLSLAPYVDETHECFHHSLTTCQGELIAQDVQVQVEDRTNKTVLVDDTLTTFDNGFVGIWLPRNIEGTIRVTRDGKSGEVDFTTDDDAPTCLTTLRMV